MSEQNGQNEGKEKQVSIIVNGRPKSVEKEKLSFEEIVSLAFGEYNVNPSVIYTISYSMKDDKKEKGILVPGDSKNVKQGMIFNVTRTDKS